MEIVCFEWRRRGNIICVDLLRSCTRWLLEQWNVIPTYIFYYFYMSERKTWKQFSQDSCGRTWIRRKVGNAMFWSRASRFKELKAFNAPMKSTISVFSSAKMSLVAWAAVSHPNFWPPQSRSIQGPQREVQQGGPPTGMERQVRQSAWCWQWGLNPLH